MYNAEFLIRQLARVADRRKIFNWGPTGLEGGIHMCNIKTYIIFFHLITTFRLIFHTYKNHMINDTTIYRNY